MSKCASCDQHNAFTYCEQSDDMYCSECYDQKLIDNECYCDDDRGITCYLHLYRLDTQKGLDMLDILIVFSFVLGFTGFALYLASMIAAICNDYFEGE